MTSSTEFVIKEKVSVDLSLRSAAREFFDFLESLPPKEITINFKGVLSISRSFADEYNLKKRSSLKRIREINVPQQVQKMFAVVEEPRMKPIIFDVRTTKAVSL